MLPLFVVENIPDRGDVVIEGDEAHHAASVVRVKVGERISVTNGKGRRAEVEILDINKRNIGCRIIDVIDEKRARTILTVVQALTKGDRARETIELLTEGGAEIIIPWSTWLDFYLNFAIKSLYFHISSQRCASHRNI
ncbi:MAG: RsmE family RNA methyltransferase [Actinobacteria bacterium]|nr:RsmE family RNA methyltransferase [Actinomycetota bacterium]